MAEWKVILLQPAYRYLERLSRQERERVVQALELLERNPEQARVKPLQGRLEWSLRVGSRRVLFVPDRQRKLFVVTTIGPRGDVYKS